MGVGTPWVKWWCRGCFLRFGKLARCSDWRRTCKGFELVNPFVDNDGRRRGMGSKANVEGCEGSIAQQAIHTPLSTTAYVD
jgi:hypothetical protein